MTLPYHTGYKLLLLNIALGLGTFIQILDTSIANVAIPYIAGSLAVSPNEGTWVITSFSASNAIVLPLTGWLSNYFGRVRLFFYSVILFSFTSFLCGISHSLTMLVVCRVLQGAVAGSLIPLSQSLLIGNNPPEKRGASLGFWSMVVVVAPVVGPILGGYISEEYDWPWIFYINLPIGLFSAFVTRSLLKDRESQIIRVPIDWIGLFLLALGVGCLQIMLDKGQDLDWFESNVIILLTIIAVISLAYFFVWNYFQEYRIVDFSFFRNKNFALGTLITTIGYLFFFGSTVIIPLWLQTEQGYTAFWAGVAVAPIGIFPIIFASIIGKNLHRIDIRILPSCSFALFAIGFFFQANFTVQISLEHLMLVRLFQGLALSIFFIPLVQLSLGNIDDKHYASASGLFNFARILVGSGFGTSLSIMLWNRREIFYHSHLTEYSTAYRSITQQLYSTLEFYSSAFQVERVNQLLDELIQQQAFMLAANELAWLAAWAFLLMIPIPFLCNKIKGTHATQSGGAH
jgi:DHA2 family multidrug resistance protein